MSSNSSLWKRIDGSVEIFERDLDAANLRRALESWLQVHIHHLNFDDTTSMCPRSIAGVPFDLVGRFQATLLLCTTWGPGTATRHSQLARVNTNVFFFWQKFFFFLRFFFFFKTGREISHPWDLRSWCNWIASCVEACHETKNLTSMREANAERWYERWHVSFRLNSLHVPNFEM